MNESLYAGCAKLSDMQRKRDMGPFFQTIHGTLNHTLMGDQLWIARFSGKRYPSPQHSMRFSTRIFDELWIARRLFDEEIAAFAAELKEDWLAESGNGRAARNRGQRALLLLPPAEIPRVESTPTCARAISGHSSLEKGALCVENLTTRNLSNPYVS